MKIWLKCLITAWDGILTPVEKRDSLEVCLCGEGYFSSGGNQTRGRGDSCFSCVSFLFLMVAFRLLQTSWIIRDMYYSGLEIKAFMWIFSCVLFCGLYIWTSLSSQLSILIRVFFLVFFWAICKLRRVKSNLWPFSGRQTNFCSCILLLKTGVYAE